MDGIEYVKDMMVEHSANLSDHVPIIIGLNLGQYGRGYGECSVSVPSGSRQILK